MIAKGSTIPVSVSKRICRSSWRRSDGVCIELLKDRVGGVSGRGCIEHDTHADVEGHGVVFSCGDLGADIVALFSQRIYELAIALFRSAIFAKILFQESAGFLLFGVDLILQIALVCFADGESADLKV